jgi:glycosyltransferase involved in cell wall biosynthesis
VKKIIIIAHFTTLPGEAGFDRFQYLAEKVAESYDVKLLTSRFHHKQKSFREQKFGSEKYEIILIEEKGYKNNVGIDRIVSHFYFEKNIKLYLGSLQEKVDLVYCAYPTMKTAYIAGNYCKERGIPFIMDIVDVWPESIKSAFPKFGKLIDLLIFPLSIFADRIYCLSENFVAVSETYLNRALKANPRVKEKTVAFIGTDAEYFDGLANVGFLKPEEEFWISYIGTLSYSYDIPTVIKAMVLLFDKYPMIKFKIMGIGPFEASFKKEAEKVQANIEFFGYLPHERLFPILKNSDVAMNAIIAGAQQSITAKLGDYLCAGLAVLNSCLNKEIISIVKEENIGFNYMPGDYRKLAQRIEYLYNNRDECASMGRNSRKLADDKFDRKKSYKKIYDMIDRLLVG